MVGPGPIPTVHIRLFEIQLQFETSALSSNLAYIFFNENECDKLQWRSHWRQRGPMQNIRSHVFSIELFLTNSHLRIVSSFLNQLESELAKLHLSVICWHLPAIIQTGYAAKHHCKRNLKFTASLLPSEILRTILHLPIFSVYSRVRYDNWLIRVSYVNFK